MEWLELKIDTSPSGLDAVTALLEQQGITGVIIGGTSMSGGSGTMVGTLIGVFIMSVLKTGLANCGLQAPWQTFLTGAVVIGAVLLDIARTKAANRVKKG